jgi:polyhydroxybutyrate depolymerase
MRRFAKLAGLVLAVSAGCSKNAATGSPGGDTPDLAAGVGGGGGEAGVPSDCSAKQAQPLDGTWMLDFGGVTRTFAVHVPASYDPHKPTPVVLDFHGLTSNGGQEIFLTGMNTKSDAEGFIAVHAEGTGNSWNAGACCDPAAKDMVDDVGFVSAMIDKLEADLCVDEKRVFSTGMSNGAFLTNRLGCELAPRIAAIAPVAGVVVVATCNPSRPVPVLAFHGTADMLVDYDGKGKYGFIGAQADIDAWAMRDGCTDAATQTFQKDDTTCMTRKVCKEGAEVTLCTVDGGGHAWPGGFPIPGEKTTMAIKATDALWDFFVKHPMP